MANIWSVLLQTLSGSVCALFLLIIKTLLADKLSPRWQYGVWSVLAFRLLIPVKEAVLLPLPLWLEVLKGYCEKYLSSSFTDIYVPICSGFSLPKLSSGPTSLTDWLFVIYLAGVLVSLGYYLLSYIRLRILLQQHSDAPDILANKLQKVCRQYQLRACKIVVVDGITSPFVCGVWKPVLAVPENTEPDDMILLHEMLHLQHHDALQNLFWAFLRSLHWFNPFLQFVFDRIGNDMETLCDQRVLERLNGEDRRTYGVILLQMANERYARVPGSTSISNGGKNIARRIEAIVRFKKYPKGMSLVSVCIIVLLFTFMFTGTADADFNRITNPTTVSELHTAMAYARIQRCSTVAGALDTYASGLLWENGIYLAMASPLSEHETLETEMLKNADDGWVSRHLETYDGLECVDGNSVYQILGLRKISDTQYNAWLLITVYGFLDEDGFLKTDGDGVVEGFVIIPVSVTYEDAWVVTETGSRTSIETPLWEIGNWEQEFPWMKFYAQTGEYGAAEVQAITRHWTRKMNVISQDIYVDGTRNDLPDPNAEFKNVSIIYQVFYTPNEAYRDTSIRCQIAALESPDDQIEFRELSLGSSNGSDSSGITWFRSPDNGTKKFPMVAECNCFWYTKDLNDSCCTLPGAFLMQICHGSTVVEEMLLTEVPDD